MWALLWHLALLTSWTIIKLDIGHGDGPVYHFYALWERDSNNERQRPRIGANCCDLRKNSWAAVQLRTRGRHEFEPGDSCAGSDRSLDNGIHAGDA